MPQLRIGYDPQKAARDQWEVIARVNRERELSGEQEPGTFLRWEQAQNQRWRKEHDNLIEEFGGGLVLTKDNPSVAGMQWYLETLKKQRAGLEQQGKGKSRESALVQKKINLIKGYIRSEISEPRTAKPGNPSFDAVLFLFIIGLICALFFAFSRLYARKKEGSVRDERAEENKPRRTVNPAVDLTPARTMVPSKPSAAAQPKQPTPPTPTTPKAVAPSTPIPAKPAASNVSSEDDLMGQVNAYLKSQGKPPVKPGSALADVLGDDTRAG